MKRILLVFGTRPEAIKMAPLYLELKNVENIEVKVCVTAQHRELLDEVVDLFQIKVDYDLNVMKENQNLIDLSFRISVLLNNVVGEFQPNIVFVHGDTTTAMITAYTCFLNKIKIAHVEAGLRSDDILSPWPEEMNRRYVSIVSDYDYVPTMRNLNNLIKENKKEENIIITGNTVIDALFYVQNLLKTNNIVHDKVIDSLKGKGINYESNYDGDIVITTHRRENYGSGFDSIFEAIKELSSEFPNYRFILPLHLNPKVRESKNKIFDLTSKQYKNVLFTEPLNYAEFIYILSRTKLILSDSGGIQEEAPSMGIPVLVLREITERQEALDANLVKLVGVDKTKIIQETKKLLSSSSEYDSMKSNDNPYGNGKAATKIVNHLLSLDF